MEATTMSKPRARDLGVPFDGEPGPLNAITDVPGVEVGHTTLIAGHGALRAGAGPVRTGVTAVLPRGKGTTEPVYAGWFSQNGNGEMTGTTWVEESGFLFLVTAMTVWACRLWTPAAAPCQVSCLRLKGSLDPRNRGLAICEPGHGSYSRGKRFQTS